MNPEDDIFFKEFFAVLLKVDPMHPDIVNHVANIRRVFLKHPHDKFVVHLSKLNDTEIEEIVRFVERPHGRHHIAELEKLLKHYPPHEVGKLFLHHFKEHEGKHLIHPEALGHI